MDIDALRLEIPALEAAFSSPEPPSLALFRSHYGFALPKAARHRCGWLEDGKYRLVCHCFDATEKAPERGTVYLLHGYFDHVGLYRHLIGFLVRLGYRVIAFDLPGHGLSSGEVATIDDFDDYRHAMVSVMAATRELRQGPVLGIGQSTGCAVLFHYLRERGADDPDLERIIMFAPLVRAKPWWLLRLLLPFFRRLQLDMRRGFPPNSHDPEFLDLIRHRDPLQAKLISVRWIDAMIANERAFMRAEADSRPLTVLQGTSDRTVEWRFNCRAIRRKFPNMRLHYIRGARHHLVNEGETFRRQLLSILESELSE